MAFLPPSNGGKRGGFRLTLGLGQLVSHKCQLHQVLVITMVTNGCGQLMQGQ